MAEPESKDPMVTPAVTVDGIWKRFGSTDVLADLSFEVRPGEVPN